uniref:Transcription repressor n=1 Tax=Leersia perrieri TaxID=77586 RepID=A0A0D9WF76_9ORYZ
MSSHEKFRLSHLIPNSWFYKLRDMKRPRPTASQIRSTGATAARSSRRSSSSSSSHYHYLHGHGTTTPKPLPLSPHRYSYYPYLQLQPPKQMPQFDKQSHLISRSPLYQISPASAVAGEDDDEFHDLQLRPIRTRPPASSSAATELTSGISGTCPSSPRLRSRRLHVLGGCESSSKASIGDDGGAVSRRCRRRSLAVVKASSEPARDFRESMVEMVVENGVRAPEDLIELLQCYLSLNSPEHHGVIVEVFRGIWVEIVADADCCVEV